MRKAFLFAAVLLAITAVSGRAQASGHIYLLRGLAGIFSTGLDALDEKLVQRIADNVMKQMPETPGTQLQDQVRKQIEKFKKSLPQ